MADANPKIATPPYVSYKSFSSFINSLREGHLPSRIDRSILGGMSGSAQSALIGSLEYLQLIEAGGKPTTALEQLVTLNGSEYNAKLRDLIAGAYAFLINEVDLKRATTSLVHEAFRKQNASGSTAVKAIAFFLAAAKDAGIEVSKHVRAPSVVRSTVPKRNTQTARGRSAEEDDDEDDGEENNTGGNGIGADVHPALAGVLMQLPPPGEAFSTKERKRFLNAFEAVLTLVYPDEDDDSE